MVLLRHPDLLKRHYLDGCPKGLVKGLLHWFVKLKAGANWPRFGGAFLCRPAGCAEVERTGWHSYKDDALSGAGA